MKDKISAVNFRKLSLAALVAGITSHVLSVIYIIIFLSNLIFIPIEKISAYITGFAVLLSAIICLSITAIVCGSIDLKRISDETYIKKGKGIDIAAVILGSIIILLILILVLEEIIIPRLFSL